MGQEYLRIQIYFPRKEAYLFRAMKALAEKQGVSMAAVARTAIKEWLDDEDRVAEVLVAASEAEAKEAPEFEAACRHRAFNQGGTIACKVHVNVCNVADCVGCGDYEPR